MRTLAQMRRLDLVPERRRRGELELIHTAMECFRKLERGYGPENHCCVEPVAGRWGWEVQVPGDGVMIGGETYPTYSTLTPCDLHLPQFERVFAVVCPRCERNTVPLGCRFCEECVR